MLRLRKGYELQRQNHRPQEPVFNHWQIYTTERIDLSEPAYVSKSQIQGNYRPAAEQYYRFSDYDPQLLVRRDRGQLKSGYSQRRVPRGYRLTEDFQ
ncbi:hypothetical protein SS50377_22956 [Spironucleus salmonicida]|uniref:Uncharacterized protein n=1 Tax=Spironucleus salmonicida TaxID=348837 RepID=A0A9P8LW08_9EUKA|nr:hypothetical protein SS50377_22947 [Spironucleus salmonicida]KAH0575327.1 hypothetical protein SS50377_22956 [Spironucleus salmonicida]